MGVLFFNTSGAGGLLRRYVHGPGIDDPVVWYEGSGTADRRFHHADERGSIVAITDNAGATIAIDSYDDWGIPAPGNLGRFQYTGQAWIAQLGMYHYKARMYSPTLGRFMQTDPIGYADGMNMYAYVGNDPVNGRDPSGTASRCALKTCDSSGIEGLTGERRSGSRVEPTYVTLVVEGSSGRTDGQLVNVSHTFRLSNNQYDSQEETAYGFFSSNDDLYAQAGSNQEVVGFGFDNNTHTEGIIVPEFHRLTANFVLRGGLTSDNISAYFHTHPSGGGNAFAPRDISEAAGVRNRTSFLRTPSGELRSMNFSQARANQDRTRYRGLNACPAQYRINQNQCFQ